MIFETHAHYDDAAFDEDRDSLLPSLPEAGIGKVVNVGASLASCRKTMEIWKNPLCRCARRASQRDGRA